MYKKYRPHQGVGSRPRRPQGNKQWEESIMGAKRYVAKKDKQGTEGDETGESRAVHSF